MLAHIEVPAFTLTVHPLGFEAEKNIVKWDNLSI